MPQGYGASEEKGFDVTQARVSAVGLTMNLDFHPKMMDKSGLYTSNVNLNNIFNEGDVSMMDEMNRLLSGMHSKGEFSAAKKFRMSEEDGVPMTGRFNKGSEGELTPGYRGSANVFHNYPSPLISNVARQSAVGGASFFSNDQSAFNQLQRPTLLGTTQFGRLAEDISHIDGGANSDDG